jgi:hypothetical protein
MTTHDRHDYSSSTVHGETEAVSYIDFYCTSKLTGVIDGMTCQGG